MTRSFNSTLRGRHSIFEATLMSAQTTTGAGDGILCGENTDYTLQFLSTGTTGIADSVKVEGSIDGTNYSVLGVIDNANTAATAVALAVDAPKIISIINAPCIKYVRGNIATLTAGSNVTVDIVGR